MPILLATDSREVHVSSDSEGKRLDIQGLRAVAVLAVIAFHVGLPVPGGFVGVDVFFVISGYVITMSMMKSPSGLTVKSLPAFYWRRFKRLIPALGVMVTSTVLLAAWILTPEGGLRPRLGRALARCSSSRIL